jgi:hypothetical protein
MVIIGLFILCSRTAYWDQHKGVSIPGIDCRNKKVDRYLPIRKISNQLLEDMRVISEAKITEITDKYNEAYRKSHFIERFKNQFDSSVRFQNCLLLIIKDDSKLSKRQLRTKGSVSEFNINMMPTSPTEQRMAYREGVHFYFHSCSHISQLSTLARYNSMNLLAEEDQDLFIDVQYTDSVLLRKLFLSNSWEKKN